MLFLSRKLCVWSWTVFSIIVDTRERDRESKDMKP